MIFRQLFETDSSTYTYLLACEQTGECVLIDPVIDTVARDLKVLQEYGWLKADLYLGNAYSRGSFKRRAKIARVHGL